MEFSASACSAELPEYRAANHFPVARMMFPDNVTAKAKYKWRIWSLLCNDVSNHFINPT